MTTHNLSHTPTRVQRRGLFAGIALLGLSGSVASSQAALGCSQTAEIHQIALCARYRAARDELNGAVDVLDSDPRWEAYFAVCDELSEWQPTTLDGLVEKARITKEEATTLDGDEELEAMSMEWAWDVINGLIQLGGRA